MDRLYFNCNTRSATGYLVDKIVLFLQSSQFTNTVKADVIIQMILFNFLIGVCLYTVLYIISPSLYKTAECKTKLKGTKQRNK